MLRSSAKEAPYYLAGCAAVLLLALSLRLLNNLELPLFYDEVQHTLRAQRILAGEPFAGLDQNKWLYGLTLSLFNPTGPEAPWLARSVNALWGTLTAAGVVRLTRAIQARRTAWMAGLLYAALPLAVFHERQALVDPQMTAFATLVLIFSIVLVRRPRLSSASLLSGALLLALLTKASALPFVIMPVAALLLIDPPARDEPWQSLLLIDLPWMQLTLRLRGAGRAAAPLLMGLSAVGLALAIRAVIYAVAANQGVQPWEGVSPSVENIALGGLLTLDGRARLITDLSDLVEMYWLYVSLPVLVLAALGLSLKTWRANLYLGLPAALFALIPVFVERPTASDQIATRYLLMTMPALCSLAALGLARIGGTPGPDAPRRLHRLAPALGVLILLPLMLFNLRLIRAPGQVRLSANDTQIFQDPTNDTQRAFNGLFNQAAALELLSIYRQESARVSAYGVLEPVGWAGVMLGPRLGTFEAVTDFSAAGVQHQIAGQLAAGDRVFLISAEDAAPNLEGAQLTALEVNPAWDAAYTLYEIRAAEGDLAGLIYAAAGREPGFMAADHAALAAALMASGPGGQVYVFPANHAEAIAGRLGDNWQVSQIAPQRWPLDEATASQALDRLPEAGLIDVVIVDPPVSDAQRLLVGALHSRLYSLGGESWHGLLNHRRYVAGPEPTFEPVEAVFEDVIYLQSAAVIDRQAQPGGVLRLALHWRTAQPVQDDFSVFVHLIGPDGLIAQHDGAPQGGLLPLTAWPVDQPVEDRLALSLPVEVPPGQYELIAGLYQPASGLRLRLTGGPGGPDHALLGQISVR